MFKIWNSKYKPLIVIYSLPPKLSPFHTVHESGVLPIRNVKIEWDIHICI